LPSIEIKTFQDPSLDKVHEAVCDLLNGHNVAEVISVSYMMCKGLQFEMQSFSTSQASVTLYPTAMVVYRPRRIPGTRAARPVRLTPRLGAAERPE
jgi:hypothetical protein